MPGFGRGGIIRISRDGADAAVGWIMLGAGFLVTFGTIDRWGRILPGGFGLAGINALITFWAGHQINQPNIPVPRSVALILAGVFILSAALSGQIAAQEFKAIHKFLLFMVFSLLLIAMLDNRFAMIGAVGAIACLFILWRLPARYRRYPPDPNS